MPSALPSQPLPTPEISIETKLDVLDSVLARLETAAPPTATPQLAVEPVAEVVIPSPVPETPIPPTEPAPAVITSPPVYVSSLSKESVGARSADRPVIEAGAGVQVVEYEPSSELPVEVESFIEQIQDHQTEQPAEIVIADGQMQIQPSAVPKKSVIVLPITPEVEDAGAKKGSKWSIRWLVEWSRKLMKIFSGKIIYREVST
jgi:hypothetical protein